MATPRDIEFLRLIDEGWDTTEAAIASGFPSSSAKQAGQRVLRQAGRSARADQNLLPKHERQHVDINGNLRPVSNTEWLLLRLESIADFNIKRVATVVDGELTFKPLNEWSDADARALKKVKSRVGRGAGGVLLQEVEFEFEAKIPAIDKLGQYHGIWAGFDQLVSGLKAYGIELVRDGDMFMIKTQDL